MKKFVLLLSLLLSLFYVSSQNVARCVIANSNYDFLKPEKTIHSDEECISTDSFDNILGLKWGMSLYDAILRLKNLGLSKYRALDDRNGLSVLFNDKVYWDGVQFNHLMLNSFVSNRQKCYLSEIVFSKDVSNINDAKRVFEQIAVELRWRFGADMVKEEFDENGNLRYYIEEDLRDSRGSGLVIKRVILGRSEYHPEFGYVVALKFNGYMEASKRVYDDR